MPSSYLPGIKIACLGFFKSPSPEWDKIFHLQLYNSNIISLDLYLIPLFTHHGTLLALAPATRWVFIFKVSTCCYICSTQLHKYIPCLQNTTFNLTASNTRLFICPFSPWSTTLLTTFPQQAVFHHLFWFSTSLSWCWFWSQKDSPSNPSWVCFYLFWPLISCQFVNYQSSSHKLLYCQKWSYPRPFSFHRYFLFS